MSSGQRPWALSELAARSTRGVRFVEPNSGHDIQVDQPQAVIRAIEHMVCVAQSNRIAHESDGCGAAW
jgi:hypothetical protein